MNDDSQLDDSTLIDETLAGHSMAFGTLVEKYQDRLANSVTHVVGSSEDARDVVQDAFVQAFVKLNTFKRNSAFYTWLYRIAFNLAISRLRRKRPTVSIDSARDISGAEPIDSQTGPDGRMEQADRAQRVQQALSCLSEEHRAVLVLREMEDYSYDTIAEILDLPVGTVRSRLHRARMQMRDQLIDELQKDLL